MPYSDVTIYIFAISYLSSMLYVYRFYDLSAWGGCWFDVYIRRFIYKFLNVCHFDNTAVAGSGKVGPVNQVNLTICLAVVTPTDRPKSVCNRCLIELFCGVVCVVILPFWHFRGCRGFCHRTESDLLLFVFKVVQFFFSIISRFISRFTIIIYWRTKQIIRYRATAILRRLQIKQYAACRFLSNFT